jgi:hypothetical protein
MHTWGLYNGRYGMSDKVLIQGLEGTRRAMANAMLAREAARQRRLEDTLQRDPATAAWMEDGRVMQNYKQLQFFDTLALYFHCTHEAERTPTRFTHVPLNRSEDTEVAITPLTDGTYTCSPYPFDQDELTLSYEGRYLAPLADGASARDQLSAAAVEKQWVSFRRA